MQRIEHEEEQYMLRKIYEELMLIRIELQAINNSLENISEYKEKLRLMQKRLDDGRRIGKLF